MTSVAKSGGAAIPRVSTIMTKIVNRLFSYGDRLFSYFYSRGHPGAIGRSLLNAAGPIVARFQPDDKWNLHVLAKYWLRGIDQPPLLPLPKSKSIFIFCVYRGAFTHHLVLAVLLAWRGHRVTIGYLPKLQSPNKPPLIDHPSARPYLRAAMGQIESLSGGRIACVDLLDDTEEVTIDDSAVAMQAHYDTVMASRKEGIDLADPKVKAMHQHMSALGRTAQVVARNHFRRHRYDVCIVGNGTTFEGSQFCRVSREIGQQVNTTEKFAFRGVRVINHGNHFLGGEDLEHIWSRREPLGYTSEPFRSLFMDKARKSIQERARNSTTTWYWNLQRAVDQSDRDAFATAGVPLDVPFILICPNVVFDAGYGKITNLFSSMREWLVGTVRFLLETTDQLIVVRAHPGEGLWWGGREPVHELLAAEGLNPGPRLVVIPGPAKVNTYRLMERCRFGVVFSSSTGLEMAVMGKNVVTASDVIYTKRGFTHDADTPEGYFRQLAAVAAAPSLSDLDQATSELALLFYFVYHWVAQYPYPYDKPSGIARLPPAKLIATADMARFLPYLDMIAMDEEEFRTQSDRFLTAEQVWRRIEGG